MIRKLSISAITLAAVGMAAPAIAAETVDVDIEVQSIAFLETTDTSGFMVIDDSADTVMGNPSSGNSLFPGDPGADYAEIKLSTNVDVAGIDVDFPRTNGIKNFSSADYFGVATCTTPTTCGTTTLGTFPQVGVLTGAGGGLVGPGNTMQVHDGSNTSLEVDNDGVAFGNGEHWLAIGVSTNWDRTLVGEPTFAQPGTYSMTLTATIIP
jgi:hypothetical protein